MQKKPSGCQAPEMMWFYFVASKITPDSNLAERYCFYRHKNSIVQNENNLLVIPDKMLVNA